MPLWRVSIVDSEPFWQSLLLAGLPGPPKILQIPGRYRDRGQGDFLIDLTCCRRSVSHWHEKLLEAKTGVKPARWRAPLSGCGACPPPRLQPSSAMRSTPCIVVAKGESSRRYPQQGRMRDRAAHGDDKGRHRRLAVAGLRPAQGSERNCRRDERPSVPAALLKQVGKLSHDGPQRYLVICLNSSTTARCGRVSRCTKMQECAGSRALLQLI